VKAQEREWQNLPPGREGAPAAATITGLLADGEAVPSSPILAWQEPDGDRGDHPVMPLLVHGWGVRALMMRELIQPGISGARSPWSQLSMKQRLARRPVRGSACGTSDQASARARVGPMLFVVGSQRELACAKGSRPRRGCDGSI
jgi:hypothetical protein